MMRTEYVIFVISLLFCSFFVILNGDVNLVYDEGIYALMVTEFSDNPAQVMPTITGEFVEWKPPLFTWVYSVFYLILKNLHLTVETTMRLPSALFAALSVSLLFLIAKELYGKNAAIAASALFLTSPALIFSSSLIMMEAFSIFLILASIYLYITHRPYHGMISIGLLILTKWLYAVVPLLFVTMYFLKSRELFRILATFLIVPIIIGLYLMISYFFGGYENVVMNLILDITRPLPGGRPLFNLFLSYVYTFSFTFPLSILFLFFVATGKANVREERATISVAILAFLLPLLQHFIVWYVIVSVPFIALFIAKRIDETQPDKLMYLLIGGLVLLNLLPSLLFSPVVPENSTKEAAESMKGKDFIFLDTKPFYSNWQMINDRYKDTDKSYLLLEQLHPGMLFYRFNDSKDYHNIHVIFAKDGYGLACAGNLMVYGEAEIPDCFELVWQKGKYKSYKAG